MNHNDVRKGATNAKFNEDNSGILFIEIVIISAAIGFVLTSWIYFGLSLFVLLFCLLFKPLAMIVSLALSICWGIIGYLIGTMFSHDASIVLGIIGFFAGLGLHASAIQWVRDIGS